MNGGEYAETVFMLKYNIFITHFSRYSAGILLYKPQSPLGFSQFEIIIIIFTLHLNTYVMGLRPVKIFYPFSAGN